jgi:hypothetical protein
MTLIRAPLLGQNPSSTIISVLTLEQYHGMTCNASSWNGQKYDGRQTSELGALVMDMRGSGYPVVVARAVGLSSVVPWSSYGFGITNLLPNGSEPV